jgi:ParB-like chromosome segregation protein Spo0J
MGMTEEEIAKERNKSLVHVRDMLVLAEATSEVQKMILAGSVGASLAVEVIREHGDQAAEFLKGKLEIAKSHGKTKVKPSLVREWIPPRKSVEQIYSSLGSLVGGLKQRADIAELIQQVGERGAQTLDGQAVSVDASTLMQLMQAFDEAEQLKAKRLRNTVESKGETDPAEGAVEQTAGEVAGA